MFESGPRLARASTPCHSLEDVLYPRKGASDAAPLTAFMRRRLALEVIAGMMHIHSRGLIHLDLKPANVLLAADGSAKLADVGLARTLHYAAHSSSNEARTPDQRARWRSRAAHALGPVFESARLTAYMTGTVAAGTPIYMAPEQWEENELTARTDVGHGRGSNRRSPFGLLI